MSAPMTDKLFYGLLAASLAIAFPSLAWHYYGLAQGSLAALISGSSAAWFVAVQMYNLESLDTKD